MTEVHRATLTYATVEGRPLRLDLYQPRSVSGPFPVVILIHGGGWTSGDRAQMEPHARALASRWIASASIEYRFAPEHVWPAQLEDVRAAVRYLRAHGAQHRLQTDRILAAGESAGAHLSLWLAVDGPAEARVQGVGSVSSLVDCTLPMTAEGASYRIVEKVLGGNPSDAEIRALSPIFRADRSTPPVYFLHGADDPWLPVAHSEVPFQRLRDLGAPTQLHVVPGMKHGLDFARPGDAEAWDDFVAWADRFFRTGPDASSAAKP